jgi:hypothetical protein
MKISREFFKILQHELSLIRGNYFFNGFSRRKLEILERSEYFMNIRGQVYIFSSIAIDLPSETEVKPRVASVEFRLLVDSTTTVSDSRIKPSFGWLIVKSRTT